MRIFLQRRYLNILLVFCSLGFLYLGYLFYTQTKTLITANQAVMHTYQVIGVANVILYDLARAESKQRGYLLTNNPEFKNLYLAFIDDVYFNVDILKMLTKDNPLQQKNIENLTHSLSIQSQSLKELTEEFESKALMANIRKSGLEKEKIIFNQTLDYTGTIINDERNLLITRNKSVIENSVRTVYMIIIGEIVGVSLILFCMYLINYQLALRVRAEKKLTSLAYYNALTKLPNRFLYLNKLKRHLEHFHRNNHFISVFVINLDNFKNINHLFGFDSGNFILKLIARRLKKLIEADQLLAHLEGNEFVISFAHTSNFDTTEFAKKILEVIAKKIRFNKQEIKIGGSIGISIYPHSGYNAEILLKNATIAMYQAKDKGKNTYQHSSVEITTEVEERALLGYYLQQAIDREEFLLFYQPKINLSDGLLSGVEALIRWKRPNGTIIYPANFISLAENNGLIITIGKWMLMTACKQLKEWETTQTPVKNLAINISPLQLESKDFLNIVKEVLTETAVNPNLLEFEVTENILIKKASQTIKTLKELKELGIKITIDDFGTGFSSLSYLKLFGADKVKIDQSFVKEIHDPDEDSIIINAVILIAHSLKLKVVAEGVETKAQEALLKRYHCDEAQGFLYSHALSSEDATLFCLNSGQKK